ncbi:MAG: HD domain-containing protein [Oscillospiraceae bacterium]|nr:HD domain-containing protein [Oscillospiraceae bacterium]
MQDKQAIAPTPRIMEALAFATKKHEGQLRRGGAPYITHPMAVCAMLSQWGHDEDTQIAGLFHDLLEDTDATEEEILRLGGEKVLEAVKLLTKKEGYIMAEYVSAIRENPMAFAVKGADRLHNLQCAVEADSAFRQRYVEETLAWYMDFSPEIPEAVKNLQEMQE